MEELKDLLPVLQALLPGFLTTIIFYWLADVQKPSQFERVLQALVCTTLISLTVQTIAWLARLAGTFYSFGAWTDTSTTLCSLALAAASGLFLALACNKDFFYSIARKKEITSKASHSDQIHIFRSRASNAVILNLKNSKRVMGYVLAIPSSETGHYLIQHPKWQQSDDSFTECENIESIFISATEVHWIEFTS